MTTPPESMSTEDRDVLISLEGRCIHRISVQDIRDQVVARLHLDDGRVVEFGGVPDRDYGDSTFTIEQVELWTGRCAHCGELHEEFTIESWGPFAKADRRFVWCEDGNHVAWTEENP